MQKLRRKQATDTCEILGKSETKEIKVGHLVEGQYKIRIWRYCNKYKKFCRYCSGKCKESPMGIKI